MAIVPPAGTSAYNAYVRNSSRGSGNASFGSIFTHLQSVMNGAGNVIPPSVDGNIHPEVAAKNLGISSYVPHPEIVSGLSSPSSAASAFKSPAKYAASSVEPSSQPQAADAFDYLDAPWASAYGMSRETAYSEAMENTAYRRSVVDMQKAGLNPAVIYGAGNGYTAGSPAYVSSSAPASFGSGGSSSYRGSGRGRSKGKLFSSSAYAVMSALGGIAGAAATRSAGGYWLGVSLTQGAMNALNLLSKR